MPYVPRDYTHFQLIAYEAPTLAAIPPGNNYQHIGRLPVSNQLPDDEKIRLKRLAGIINFAKNRMRAGDNANTLKIFMAPEFYFRPNAGPHNSYTRGSAMNLIDALRKLLVHPGLRDWLFVPGTIFWHQPAGGGRVYFNTALIIKGGPNAPFTFIHKRLISGIDGAPVVDAAALNPHLRPILQKWDEERQNVITIDNRGFGIEVCLDHADDAACHTLDGICVKYRQKLGILPLIDIHLLTACGMPLNVRSSAARAGGYILRVDGHPHPAALPHSEIQRITAQKIGGNATHSNQNDAGAPLANTQWHANVPPPLEMDPAAAFVQRIVCYNRQLF